MRFRNVEKLVKGQESSKLQSQSSKHGGFDSKVHFCPERMRKGTGMWGPQSCAEIITRREAFPGRRKISPGGLKAEPRSCVAGAYVDGVVLIKWRSANFIMLDANAARCFVPYEALLCALSHLFLTAVPQKRRKWCC